MVRKQKYAEIPATEHIMINTTKHYVQFGFVRCTNNLAKMLGLDLNFAN